MRLISNIYMGLLLLSAVGMLIWGLAGFFEYFTGIVPIIALQNAAYPSGTQFVHWFLITLTGGAFLTGYITRWKWTPILMILLYSNLGVLCTIQTFDFMSEQWGFSEYYTEMGLYVVHSLFLLFSKVSRSRFGFDLIGSSK